MLLHIDQDYIKKLGLYDSRELLDEAQSVKDKFEILILSAPGMINPAEMGQYKKYFGIEYEKETSVEDDLKEFEKISKILEVRYGRQKN
jgi:hypothetical protein